MKKVKFSFVLFLMCNFLYAQDAGQRFINSDYLYSINYKLGNGYDSYNDLVKSSHAFTYQTTSVDLNATYDSYYALSSTKSTLNLMGTSINAAIKNLNYSVKNNFAFESSIYTDEHSLSIVYDYYNFGKQITLDNPIIDTSALNYYKNNGVKVFKNKYGDSYFSQQFNGIRLVVIVSIIGITTTTKRTMENKLSGRVQSGAFRAALDVNFKQEFAQALQDKRVNAEIFKIGAFDTLQAFANLRSGILSGTISMEDIGTNISNLLKDVESSSYRPIGYNVQSMSSIFRYDELDINPRINKLNDLFEDYSFYNILYRTGRNIIRGRDYRSTSYNRLDQNIKNKLIYAVSIWKGLIDTLSLAYIRCLTNEDNACNAGLCCNYIYNGDIPTADVIPQLPSAYSSLQILPRKRMSEFSDYPNNPILTVSDSITPNTLYTYRFHIKFINISPPSTVGNLTYLINIRHLFNDKNNPIENGSINVRFGDTHEVSSTINGKSDENGKVNVKLYAHGEEAGVARIQLTIKEGTSIGIVKQEAFNGDMFGQLDFQVLPQLWGNQY